MSQLFGTLLLALAAPTDLTGVYEVSGAPSDVFLVLHERAEGELIGYLAGSPTVWIESGQRYGNGALIQIQGSDGDSEEPWSAILRLRVLGRTLEGVLLQEGEVLPLTLVRSNLHFSDETWLWYDMGNNAMHDVSRLRDLGGNFIGGGFNSSESCMFMACGGSIDSWQETTGNHDIWTSSTGGCGQTGHLIGVFDTSTNQLDGTWDSTDCNSNTSNGSFLGGKGGSTYGKHVQALLLSLGTFADDFEAESMDAADVFHTNYLSDGTTRADWEAQLSAWYTTYDDIEVEISGPDEIITVIDSDVHPYLLGDARTAWTIRASGVDTTTGASETFYERIEPVVLGPDLRFLGAENGRVVFIGNGETHPLSIGLPILLGDVSYDVYGAWPFGQHGGGHADDGHGGIDFEYVPGAVCYAVADGEVVDVRLNDGHPPSIQWDIIQQIRPGVNVQYGHIADPPIVSIGDVLAAGDVVGSPSIMPGDSHAVIHFSISYQEQQQGNGDMCPVPWFNAAAAADWDVIWPLSHYNEELAEPLECNNREADPPYVATWNLVTPGSSAGPDAILFLREDGYAHNYVYTFFDAAGSVYETGVTEWMTSPGTHGLKFIADCTGNLTFAALDVIGEEMTFKYDSIGMPTDMTGAATYLWDGAEPPSPDAKLYVSNVFDNTVSIVDISTGSTSTISVGTQPAHMAYSPMSDKVLLGNIGASELHTLSTPLESLVDTLAISGPAASLDIHTMTNKVYAVDTPGSELHVIDMATGTQDVEATIGYELQDIRVDSLNNIAYVTDFGDLLNPLTTEGVIAYNTCDDTVITWIPLADAPHGLAIDSTQDRLFVTRLEDDSISIIDINPSSSTYHQEIGAPISVGDQPEWIALSQKHGKAYVTNLGDGTVSVIDMGTNTVLGSPIVVGVQPFFVITDDDSNLAYVTNFGSDTVSVIDMDSDAVVETIDVGSGPVGMALIK